MALVLKDRVKETTTTTSTGTYTLGGAQVGYQSFSVVGNGNSTYYTVTDGTNWEVGIGTYTSSGTLLSRDTIFESSNGGSAVNWGAGSKDVFVTYPAERAVANQSTATDALAIGSGANTSYQDAVAIGKGASVVGPAGIALGNSYSSDSGFAAAIGANTSSFGASGSFGAIAIGYLSKATNDHSIAIGSNASATNDAAIAIGYEASASGIDSVAILKGVSTVTGKLAFSGGYFSLPGTAQAGRYVLLAETTDGSTVALTTNNLSASTDNQIVVPASFSMGFHGIVVARVSGGGTAVWEIKGALDRSTGNVSLGSYNINIISDSITSLLGFTPTISLAADTTNQALAIQATGYFDENLRWCATVTTAEVYFP
jgi:hypothetical protein